MPTQNLWELVESKGVPLEKIAEVLKETATRHFGPRLALETNVAAEKRAVELFAAFRIRPEATEPATLSLAKAHAHFGSSDFQLDDEMLVQIFFAPEDQLAADAQDHEYEVLTGISIACSGFWPVARKALAPLLELPEEDPIEAILQRALLLTVATPEHRGEKFVLRHGRGALFIKERIVVGDGEIKAGHFGRRDLIDGVEVEVIRKEVPVTEVISGLFGSEAISLACEGTDVSTGQLVAAFKQRDVHLDRKTAFRTHIARLVGEQPRAPLEQFALLVSSERDARFIP